ncbi:MAG: hypothetical protein GWP59_08975 [Chlamydiales bacterium]|nr:hypothetical protein [Chlamydiales bacterium]NCF71818.1 hypothetical protein [Chlamydiales bacterium]
MSKFKKVLLLTCCYIPATVFSFTGEGYHNIQREVIEDLDFKGSIDLEGVEVKKTTKVQGAAKIEGGRFLDLIVSGVLDVEDAKIQGNTEVIGELDAESTEFQQQLMFTGEELELKSSTANDIVIKVNGSKKHIQRLHIKEGSKVSGNITFESGNGEVVIDEESSFSGNLEGGKIVEEA